MSIKPVTYDYARSAILERVSLLKDEQLELIDAAGRILAEDIRAPHELPCWNNSAMDGFAVCMEDNQPGKQLAITGFIPAGKAVANQRISPGTTVKVMTGAPTPPGTEAIVPIEDATQQGDSLVLEKLFKKDDHIRFQGEDIIKDELILPKGTYLRPSEINILASFGWTSVKVFRQPRVAILSTGDELVEPGETTGPGQIVNSNAYSLAAAVKEAGGVPLLLGIARDTRESLEEKFSAGLDADVFITSAGVSMGDHDLVCEILESSGVEQIFWMVDIKPGRPTAFGMRGSTPVFSLPGNPVSTLVTFEEFVRPALMKMQGHSQVFKSTIKVLLDKAVSKKLGRRRFLRVKIEERDGQKFAVSAGNQHTAMVKTMLRAEGLAILPEDCDHVDSGAEVDFHLM